MNKIILRAITAFSRTDLKGSNETLSVVGREVVCFQKQFVLLESQSTHDLVAVYRCMNRGELKRLKRWPAELTRKMPAQTVRIEKSNVPAILELSPVKTTAKTAKKAISKKSKSEVNTKQNDLFN
jgi:hypothetical protein